MYIVKIVNNIFIFYFLLIILRIFLTWIPSIDWNQQPIKSVREVTDMYLNIFRRFVPPFGGLISLHNCNYRIANNSSLVVNVLANIVGSNERHPEFISGSQGC